MCVREIGIDRKTPKLHESILDRQRGEVSLPVFGLRAVQDDGVLQVTRLQLEADIQAPQDVFWSETDRYNLIITHIFCFSLLSYYPIIEFNP